MTDLVARGFEPIAVAFAENVAEHGDDHGASCAVYHDGELVVDLRSGSHVADAAKACVFSVSKGITTICLLMAAERGLLSLDGAVSTYWPEFAAEDKSAVTVRQVLSHQAGLAWPEQDLTLQDVADWGRVTSALARQAPAWAPGTAYAYHALTVGWLAGEVLRRTSGLRPNEWLARHIARPLDLDMSFGVQPEALPLVIPLAEPLPIVDAEAAATVQQLFADDRAVRALSLGGAIDPFQLFGCFNSAQLLTCELPAANLVTNARSLARLYAAAAGEVDGVHLLRADTVADASRPQSEGMPFVGIDEGHRWGTGFMVASRRRGMAGEGSFGHDGAGGQLAFGHTAHRLGFGYITSRPGGIPDDRAEALSRALRISISHTNTRSLL